MLPRVYTIMFWVSISLTVLAVISVAVYGLRLSVDFSGGSVIEVDFTSRPPAADIQKTLSSILNDIEVSPVGPSGMIFRTHELSEDQHQQILGALISTYDGVQEKQFSSIGPVIGNELKQKSIYAIVTVLLAIIIYIAFVFRKIGRTTSPWVMGLAAIVALVHDVAIPFGVFAWLGHYYSIEITGVFVAAALTILGFSVSDTVVIFDRVRENILRKGSQGEFGRIVHQSVLQTLTRSLNTVFTVLLSLFAIYFFGGESIRYFALALIIGIFLGAYSSIFVASPLLVWWSKKR